MQFLIIDDEITEICLNYRLQNKNVIKSINNVYEIITHTTHLWKFLISKKLVTTPTQNISMIHHIHIL